MDHLQAVQSAPLSSRATDLHPSRGRAQHDSQTDARAAAAYDADARDDTDPLAPPAEFRAIAYETNGETFQVRVNALRQLRHKIATYNDRPMHNMRRRGGGGADADGDGRGAHQLNFGHVEDSLLIIFLRSKAFRVEAAFKKFVNYSKARAKNAWLTDVDMRLVQKLFSTGSFEVLPSHDAGGRLLLSMNMKELTTVVDELGRDNAKKLLAAIFGMLDTISRNIRAQLFGLVILADLDECKAKTMWYLNISQYLLSLDLCQHCIPLKANGMYVVNEPWIVRSLFNVMRPFMKPSVQRSLLCFGDDVCAVHRHVPRECLIETYAGTLTFDQTEHTQRWVETVKSCCG